MSLDPRITLGVYIVGGLLFIGFLLWMFIYSSRMKNRKLTEEMKGRPPVDTEEGIAVATEKGKKF